MIKSTIKRKKICVLHHAVGLGGGSKSFIDLVLMLRKKYDVIACIPAGDSPLKNILLDHGIELYEINVPYPQLPRYSGGPRLLSRTMFKYIYNLKYIKRFCKEIEKKAPDMVIYNSIVTTITAPFLAKHIKKICFIRETIVSIDGCLLYRFILKKYFDGACFLSSYDLKLLSSKTLKSVVIPDSVSSEDIFLLPKEIAREKEKLAKDNFVVLYMGGDDRIKGANTLLEAFKYVDPRNKLVIAGNFMDKPIGEMRLWNLGEMLYRYQLGRKFRCLEQRGQVISVGIRKDISNLMNACDIVAFPSTKVHQSRPCIEAGYYYKPVIISDFEQTKEYFVEGYNALTFKSGKAKELADRINYAARHRKQLEEMGRNNYKMSMMFHNYEKTQEELLKFLTQVLT